MTRTAHSLTAAILAAFVLTGAASLSNPVGGYRPTTAKETSR